MSYYQNIHRYFSYIGVLIFSSLVKLLFSYLIVHEFNVFYLIIYYFAVLSDSAKRLDYDLTGNYEIDKYTLRVRSFIISSGVELPTCVC